MPHDPDFPSLAIRRAGPDDARRLSRLATLDCRRPPLSDLLVAELGGELVAAIGIEDGCEMADPFRPTAAAIELLRVRVAQLRRQEESPAPRRLALLFRRGIRRSTLRNASASD